MVQFQVVDRQALAADDEVAAEPAVLLGDPQPPEPWETGTKDTVLVYPRAVTRIKARFDKAGSFVWHCHILEHEDNEMMRPFLVTQRTGGADRPRRPRAVRTGGALVAVDDVVEGCGAAGPGLVGGAVATSYSPSLVNR
jgi:hypothetical protein